MGKRLSQTLVGVVTFSVVYRYAVIELGEWEFPITQFARAIQSLTSVLIQRPHSHFPNDQSGPRHNGN